MNEFPVHPTTGLRAIGFLKGSRPVWPVMGAAEDGGDGGDGGDAGKSGGENSGSDTKVHTQAEVDRIVRERLARETSKYADYKDLQAAAAKLAEIEAQNQSETEKAVDKAKQETEQSVRSEVMRERVLDRVEVLAAKDFADTDDARLRLQARADEFVAKDGSIDADAIKAALVDLLKDKPHLAAGGTGRPKADLSQGSRGRGDTELRPGLDRMRDAYANSKTS